MYYVLMRLQRVTENHNTCHMMVKEVGSSEERPGGLGISSKGLKK
jgi:hypothetical protein